MAVTVNIRGLREIEENINKRIGKIKNASKKGIKKAGNFLLSKSLEKAPILSGDLRRSGTVDDSELNTNGSVKVGYNTPYALRQHEEYPDKSDPNAEWKYLENPFKENADNIIKIIEKETNKGVEE